MEDAQKLLEPLAKRYSLSSGQIQQLARLAVLSTDLEISGTAVTTVDDAVRVHIADSVAGLEIEAIRAAGRLVDIGSGVGFPGLLLAALLPGCEVVLVDSVRKKMEAAGRMAREAGISNIECVWARAEEIAALGSERRESFDVVTARALAPLTTLIEYSAPLLKVGGTLVAWKGSPDQAELSDAAAAERELGFSAGELVPSRPFESSERRHFYLTTKQLATTERYPRRPGLALKKPIAATSS